jgi:RHS repeat-associated protein
LDVLGKTFTGSGNSVSATWDGKLADGTVVKPGSYSATLTATTADGQCTDSKTANFTVTPAPDGQCGLYVQFGSSAHLASGNLSHSQNLFSSQGGSLPLGLTLYYNSLDPANGALGRGWSHSYSYNLKENSDGSVLISEPNWRYRFYSPSGTGYSTQAGNYAVLAKDSTGFTLTEREGTVYRFNTSGQLASITDRNGNSQTFSYTGNNLTSMTDPAGHTATLGYDSANHLTTIVDQSGNSYTLAVGASLTTVTQPDNSTWQYSYDTNSFMLGKIDPLGNSTSYSYDEQQRVIGSTDPEGKSRSITYPQTSETIKNTTFTEKDGSSWSYSYDTQKGYLLSKTDPQSGTTSYQYDANGNRTSTTNPDGTATSSLYDNQGNLLSNTDAAGNTTSYTYNSFGQATSISDSQGGITRYSYDAKGNLTSLTDPAGATTSYQYDSKGNMTRLTDAAGQSTSFGYNAAGNMTSVTDASGATTNYSYDAAGNITAITDASGGVTSFSYDSRGRLIKTVNPQGNATSYSYDKNGNKLSATDANGNTTRYEYNSRNQLIKTTDALGNSTVYAYGSNACPSCGGGVDKLTALTDANNNVTRYDYDSLGRLMKETDPLGKITSYSYDTKGNLIARTDAKGQTISYSYDANGRLLKKSYPDNTEESFSYDAKGNILTAANKNIAYSFSYDVAGRMLSSSDSNGNTISYSYDAAGRKTHTVYPDGSKISYGYDTAGRLASITDQHNNRFSLTYTSLGQRAKLSYPNSSSAGYQYDSTGNLTNLSHQTHGRPVSTFSYTHDKVGNRLTRTELFRTTSYTYDSIYRLLTARINRRAAEQYSYDPVGNRLTGPEQQTDYSYGIGNQLLKQERTSYRYDDNGNLAEKGTSHSRHSHHCEHHNKPWNYRFDYENRLIEAENGNITVSFSYDPFGRRIEKKVEQSNRHGHHEHHGNAGEQTTRYLYDGQALIQETTTRGNHRAARPETVSYIHGPNIDEPLQGTSHNKTWYYHADGLGSIVALTDKHGNVVQRYDYDSFGNLQQQGESIEQPFTYTARELDEETGLYYYRARYYDPQVGRFVTKDPIGFDGGDVNLYAYVGNNAINKKDPTGLSVYYCKASDGWKHAWVCVNNSCAGLMPKGSPSIIYGQGEIVREQFTKDCTAKDVSSDKCCDQNKYESCVKREAIDKIGTSHSYGFSGLGAGNCNAWAQEVIVKCQREACKK